MRRLSRPTISLSPITDWVSDPLRLRLTGPRNYADLADFGPAYADFSGVEPHRAPEHLSALLAGELRERVPGLIVELHGVYAALSVAQPFEPLTRATAAVAVEQLLSERANGRFRAIIDWGTLPLRQSECSSEERYNALRSAWAGALGPFLAGQRGPLGDRELWSYYHTLATRHELRLLARGIRIFAPGNVYLETAPAERKAMVAAFDSLVLRGWAVDKSLLMQINKYPACGPRLGLQFAPAGALLAARPEDFFACGGID